MLPDNHIYEYSKSRSRMDSISGFEMDIELENCKSGLQSPRPPNLVGSSNISLSVSLGACLPVMIGIKTVRMMLSNGSKMLLMLGMVRDK